MNKFIIKIDRQSIKTNKYKQYRFEYKKTLIKCDYCKQEFLHTELEEDWDETADDCYPIHNICPKCGSNECCDIEYENIDDVLKELENKK